MRQVENAKLFDPINLVACPWAGEVVRLSGFKFAFLGRSRRNHFSLCANFSLSGERRRRRKGGVAIFVGSPQPSQVEYYSQASPQPSQAEPPLGTRRRRRSGRSSGLNTKEWKVCDSGLWICQAILLYQRK